MSLTTLLCVLTMLVNQPATTAAEEFQVIVNASSPLASLSKDELSRIFLKRQVTWKNGNVIVPVDHERDSRLRAVFTRVVHKRSVAAIGTYWQQQIFAGRELPPADKASDREVIDFVRSNPNSIGYVSAGVAAEPGVKVIAITQ